MDAYTFRSKQGNEANGDEEKANDYERRNYLIKDKNKTKPKKDFNKL